jgi:hypothetical protein
VHQSAYIKTCLYRTIQEMPTLPRKVWVRPMENFPITEFFAFSLAFSGLIIGYLKHRLERKHDHEIKLKELEKQDNATKK